MRNNCLIMVSSGYYHVIACYVLILSEGDRLKIPTQVNVKAIRYRNLIADKESQIRSPCRTNLHKIVRSSALCKIICGIEIFMRIIEMM